MVVNRSFALALLLLAVGAAVFARSTYRRGVGDGLAAAGAAHTQAQLVANAAHQRELERQAAAATARVAAADSQAAVDKARSARARVAADSLRRRVALLSDSSVSIDSGEPEPLDVVIVSLIHEADRVRQLDSLAMIGMEQSVASLRELNGVQRLSIRNLVQRDSLFMERVGQLHVEAKAAEKRGFWKGVKVGAGAALGILAAIALAIDE